MYTNLKDKQLSERSLCEEVALWLYDILEIVKVQTVKSLAIATVSEGEKEKDVGMLNIGKAVFA